MKAKVIKIRNGVYNLLLENGYLIKDEMIGYLKSKDNCRSYDAITSEEKKEMFFDGKEDVEVLVYKTSVNQEKSLIYKRFKLGYEMVYMPKIINNRIIIKNY